MRAVRTRLVAAEAEPAHTPPGTEDEQHPCQTPPSPFRAWEIGDL